jgi:hypothetical protein
VGFDNWWWEGVGVLVTGLPSPSAPVSSLRSVTPFGRELVLLSPASVQSVGCWVYVLAASTGLYESCNFFKKSCNNSQELRAYFYQSKIHAQLFIRLLLVSFIKCRSMHVPGNKRTRTDNNLTVSYAFEGLPIESSTTH